MNQKNQSHSRYPVPELDSLPEDARNTINGVADKAGFIPNVFSILSRRPDEFRAFFAMSNRLASVTGMLPNNEFYSMGRS